ncbi:hypothetical protein [uncultured Jannaschia sp.]|uniref:hypothetical protein n=1 Tax=uncultured Jannaschia sp. TaxID=293347 RepID=UPI0026259266|nr:hypothetical protein [uncultured Jannaschia sp.]
MRRAARGPEALDMGGGRGGTRQRLLQDAGIVGMPETRDRTMGRRALRQRGRPEHAHRAGHHLDRLADDVLGGDVDGRARPAPPRRPDRHRQLAPAAIGIGRQQIHPEELGQLVV